ncbi:MAG: hypothetical protein L0I62_03800 [Gammaproteobacteria bacterium]|nr:hypothetical protein [Gammaproteobacteria bacterium]
MASFMVPAGAAAVQGYSSGNASEGGSLVYIVRNSSRRFRDVNVAYSEGYVNFLGCVSGPDMGAMGQHLVNFALVGDGILDPTQPEVLVYKPRPNGTLRLVAVEFLALYDVWHANNDAPPVLEGQSLFLVNSPNRFGLPAFYTMHVWAFEYNPNGAFAMWNPRVSCAHFGPYLAE